MTGFKYLKISEWQQFDQVEIDFHNKLTVLTGANASGKTTILHRILARHAGWDTPSYSTPIQDKVKGIINRFTRWFNGENKNEDIIGHILYTNDQQADIQIPISNSIEYVANIINQQGMRCFFIPSHRSLFRYQHIENTPLTRKDKNNAFADVSNLILQRYHGDSSRPVSYSMKETLLNWKIKGYGVGSDDERIGDQELIQYLEGFQDVLRQILPKTSGFNKFKIVGEEVVFDCNNGKDQFILEQSSGGMSSLIEIAWLIYMFSTEGSDNFTVIIDEVENHLHPTMQRSVLPDLLSAFPNASFVVSTHSPLVVGSVRDSSVYALVYNDRNKIVSEKLDLVNQAKTATEILDEVLGVSFTMPIWAEEELKKIIKRYSSKEMTEEEFKNMRDELSSIGLEKLMPKAIGNIVKNKSS